MFTFLGVETPTLNALIQTLNDRINHIQPEFREQEYFRLVDVTSSRVIKDKDFFNPHLTYQEALKIRQEEQLAGETAGEEQLMEHLERQEAIAPSMPLPKVTQKVSPPTYGEPAKRQLFNPTERPKKLLKTEVTMAGHRQ